MERVVAFFGLFGWLGICYLLCAHKKHINKRTIVWGMGLQIIFALLVLGVPALGIRGPIRFMFDWANDAVLALLAYTEEGSRFIFGSMIDTQKFGFIFAFQVLPSIIFISALMAVMYHAGLMQKVVKAIAGIMQKSMGTSGAETLSNAANIFVGQTEAPLLIKPYIQRMTRSEILAIMVGGMANVAGGVLAAYVGLLKDRIPDIAGHLLTMSVLTGPASLVVAKMILPETTQPETLGKMPRDMKKIDHNLIEAAARGAGEGVSLAVNVAAMLLAFIALIAMCNGILKGVGNMMNFEVWGADLVPAILRAEGGVKLSLELIFGWLFAPFAWMMGVPTNEIFVAGAFLGEKVVLNEFVAYLHLSKLASQLSDRTVVIMSYALCGFANFSSIAIQIGGIGAMAPERRSDIASLGIKAVIGGSIAAFMTANLAAILM